MVTYNLRSPMGGSYGWVCNYNRNQKYCLTASAIDSSVNSRAESKLGVKLAASANLGNANKEVCVDARVIWL